MVSLKLTEGIGTVFYHLSGGNPFLINVGFQTIAFVGIVMFLKALDPDVRLKILPLILLPSFNLWSSVASKECIVVFAVCIIARYIVRIYRDDDLRIRFIEIFAFLLIYIYKNHYIPAIVFILMCAMLSRYVAQRTIIVLTGGFISAVGLFLFRDRLGDLALEVQTHWTIGDGQFVGRATREFFFHTQSDVFTKAPEGMFQSFFGPTISDMSIGLLQKVAFFESTFIMLALAYMFYVSFWRLPIYNFFVGLLSLFWILFPSYPLGVMNAGSAIRYRTGHFVIVLLIFAFLMTRRAYYERPKLLRGTPEQAAG